MKHKEMLIWHKETLKSEKGYKSRSKDRFGFNSISRCYTDIFSVGDFE